ncbi:MAG: amidohydrolase [Anaerolineales bacterium]|nr:amidohydrolase [Anaerolineales bacterium]
MKKWLLTLLLLAACAPNAPATETSDDFLPLVTADATHEADLVLHNGAIYTVDEAQPWAEAVAIKAGRLIFVGADEDVEPFIGEATEIMDLGGRMVLPGIHDVHLHPLEAGSSVGGTCLLPEDTDPAEMVGLLRDCAPKQIGTNWVLGWGHSITNMLESERPPIEILDEAIPDRPAVMMEQTSHSVWVNSAALAAAGMNADTPNPPGGLILKDPETGEPNGILMENAGDMLFDLALAPTPELEELHYDGLLYALEQLAENGITSISDARTYWGRNYHKVWQRAEQEETLTVRAVLGLWAYPHYDDAEQLAALTKLYSNDPNRLLRMSQIKIYSDGLIENTTAALFEPYLIDLEIFPDNIGMNYFAETRLAKYITTLEKVGFDFHIHTIGDRGVYEALNAIEQAVETNGNGLDRRHRLTHLELIDEADRLRFAELDVIADFQVAGEFTLPDYWEESAELIGDRAFDPVPVRSIYDTGATVTLSSDWDVSDLSPFVGMAHALQREQQSMPDLEAVIEAYTLNGAYVMRQETETGSLEVGKWADLVVLDQNLFEVSLDEMAETAVLLTLLGGEEVYRNPSFR